MIIVYHVFTNGWDEWTRDYDEAKRIYLRMLKEYRQARLYKEEYETEKDVENDNVDCEDCLRSYGDYPL